MKNDNIAPGILEYLVFKNATITGVLATLLVTSLLSVFIIPVVVDSPAKAEQSSEKDGLLTHLSNKCKN